MPKIKKIRAAALTSQSVRHEPLGQTIQDDQNRNKYASSRKRRNKLDQLLDGDEKELLDEKTSERILALSKEQRQELDAEEELQKNRKKQTELLVPDDSDDEDDKEKPFSVEEDYEDDDRLVQEEDGGYITMVEGAPELSAEEEALVASMMQSTGERKSLADLILEKIGEKEAEKAIDDDAAPGLPPKVVEVYTDIGKILTHYTSGKLPKAFKVIPSLSNWEEVLYLTRPDKWTPQAMFAATRIFASNLNPKMAQRFYNLILLDGVRADIHANKKLNYHYYMALKKSVYKPAAFFKGILLPLCQDDCTLREAAIVASVLQRVSIPVLHSAVAIHKLAQLKEYNGAASIFIKTLLDKKYSLPAPVIGSLVQHFANFVSDDRTLPVLWHQALLVFCQRYKNEVQDEARNSLRLVMKKHFHPKITPEIRRELFGAQAWKEERAKDTDSMML
ncbi:K14797 essential nuclear protein 1 [Seminavis robusta]|uniref:K14797 essential nuclear protein 1 n=1 Tax=Seminavis robusta TaxID=568900 RepID=A0A9N8DGW1_9STRA|nr:K14797 essential nuclear protein 1 [Seminavis robusta]|eukprot:Sro120_g058400.1 K14797 essential nuclear protein 1 (448) ;mRNA; f:35849-37287